MIIFQESNFYQQIFIRYDLPQFYNYQSLIMKVKFIPKKQRQIIKAQKDIVHIDKPHENHESTLRSETAQDSIREGNHESTLRKYAQTKNKIIEQPVISEHFIRHQNDNSFDQIRERSRDNKYKEISKNELQQRAKMKSKLLGLEKVEESKRFNPQYRSQLLFQWDKSDDTSQSFVPMFGFHLNSKNKDILEKDFGQTWKEKDFSKMQDRDWRIFRQDHQIYIRGGKAPYPVRQWKQIDGANFTLLENLKKLSFEKPKPIQMQSIPIGMMHKDLMAIAPTGEGKTLGYLFPIIHFLLPLERLNMNNFDQGPYALILVPTRQLAQQIDQQFKKFTKNLKLSSFVAVGGRQFQLQSIQLSKGCDILIGTPGRIKQFMQKHHLSLQRLSWCVIDEADKMVSQNLSEDIEFILDFSGQHSLFGLQKKIIHMFSATMVPQVEKLGKQKLSSNYTYITIGEPGGGKKEIDQHVQLIDQNSKPDRLNKILRGLNGPLIVFVNSRQKCQKVANIIKKRTDRLVAEYHGGKNQEQRERVINNLKTKRVEILVATDLAGRGLDVKGINAVINYDAPKNISEFVHRSGRTGRAGMKGKAFTLLTTDDQGIFYDLRVFLQRNQFTVPENLKQNPASMVRPGGIVNVKRSKQIVYTN